MFKNGDIVKQILLNHAGLWVKNTVNQMDFDRNLIAFSHLKQLIYPRLVRTLWFQVFRHRRTAGLRSGQFDRERN
jgi:hypothetical protein